MTQFPADMNLQTATTVTGTQQQLPSHDEYWAKALADAARQQGGTASTPNIGAAIGGYAVIKQIPGACPHCGYCPHCGHKSPTYPPYTYPMYPSVTWGGSLSDIQAQYSSGTAQTQGGQTHQNIN